MKFKPRRAALVLLGAGIVVAAGLLYFLLHHSAAGDVLTLYGDVDIRQSQPAFYDTGPVTQLLVSEGARVTKGELIARIDDYLIETTLTTILAFGSYLIADRLGFSGVLAVDAESLFRAAAMVLATRTQLGWTERWRVSCTGAKPSGNDWCRP